MQINNTILPKQNYTGKQAIQVNLNEFLNATDAELYLCARNNYQNKHKNDKVKFIASCIGVSSVSNMILKNQIVKKNGESIEILKAPLSAKLGEGLKTVKNWGLGIAAVSILMGVKNILMRTNKKFKEAEENHPIISSFAEIGALALGYKGTEVIVKKTGLANNLLKKINPLNKKIKSAADKIDKSKIATFIMNRGTEFSNFVNTKAPALSKTGKILLSSSGLIMLIGGMTYFNNENKRIEKEYSNLKFTQEQIRQNL